MLPSRPRAAERQGAAEAEVVGEIGLDCDAGNRAAQAHGRQIVPMAAIIGERGSPGDGGQRLGEAESDAGHRTRFRLGEPRGNEPGPAEFEHRAFLKDEAGIVMDLARLQQPGADVDHARAFVPLSARPVQHDLDDVDPAHQRHVDELVTPVGSAALRPAKVAAQRGLFKHVAVALVGVGNDRTRAAIAARTDRQ